MSKIKEQLIGYEHNPWYDEDDHARVQELGDYVLYSMSILEMENAARQSIRYDLYNMTKEDFDKMHREAIGRYDSEQV